MVGERGHVALEFRRGPHIPFVAADLWRGRRLLATLGRPRPRLWRPRIIDAVTFDVFDTLIGRSVDRGEVFASVASRLADIAEAVLPADAVIELRGKAERRAQAAHGHCATLLEIHEQLAAGAGWDVAAAPATAEAEITAELGVSRRLEEGPALLDEARRAGLRVLFLSDMHLPSPTVRSMLDAAGCWQPSDRLWVSSESRARKRDGSLFRLVIDVDDVDPSRTVHVGDHPYSDRVVPRWLGFGVHPVKRQ